MGKLFLTLIALLALTGGQVSQDDENILLRYSNPEEKPRKDFSQNLEKSFKKRGRSVLILMRNDLPIFGQTYSVLTIGKNELALQEFPVYPKDLPKEGIVRTKIKNLENFADSLKNHFHKLQRLSYKDRKKKSSYIDGVAFTLTFCDGKNCEKLLFFNPGLWKIPSSDEFLVFKKYLNEQLNVELSAS